MIIFSPQKLNFIFSYDAHHENLISFLAMMCSEVLKFFKHWLKLYHIYHVLKAKWNSSMILCSLLVANFGINIWEVKYPKIVIFGVDRQIQGSDKSSLSCEDNKCIYYYHFLSTANKIKEGNKERNKQIFLSDSMISMRFID